VPEAAPHGLSRASEAVGLGIAGLSAAAFAASFGFNFGVGNQVTYLIPALRLLDPGLFTRDWFATGTTQYHPLFAKLGATLMRLDPQGWAVALGLTLTVTAAALALYALVTVLRAQPITPGAAKKRMLIIVNPYATTVSDRLKNLVVYALQARYDVEAVDTEASEHAIEIGREARDGGCCSRPPGRVSRRGRARTWANGCRSGFGRGGYGLPAGRDRRLPVNRGDRRDPQSGAAADRPEGHPPSQRPPGRSHYP
jgi:hypothetical protein